MLRAHFLTLVASFGIVASLSAQSPDDSTARSVRLPQFSDYPVRQFFRGAPHATDFASNPNARLFRTSLQTSPTDTISFAGRLRVVLWGCGTQCQSGVLVDAVTGRVYDLPEVLGAGADYRADSRLFIVNPESALNELFPAGEQRPAWAHPCYYVWTDSMFTPTDASDHRTRAP